MYSALLLLTAALGLAVGVRVMLAWRRLQSNLVLFNLAALAAVALAVLLAGLGHRLGAGDRLRDLYALPMLISMVAMPLTLYTFATLARRLGFAWARIDWGHGAVCLFAAALLLWNLRGIFALKQIYPACWRDVVWYLPSVPPGLACAGAPASDAAAEFPLALISVLAAWLALGAGLWRQRHEAWLFAAMGTGIILMLAPPAAGPLPRALGETLCFSAMALAAVRYASAAA